MVALLHNLGLTLLLIDYRLAAQEIANLKREASELNSIREKMDSPDFVKCIFEKVFGRDINRLLSMEDMWKSRTPPTPLNHAEVLEAAIGVKADVAREDQRVWSLAENYAVFADSVHRLAKRMLELKANAKEGEAPPVLSFDKDDEDTLDFVAAGANLRSHVFGIELKSKFAIKGDGSFMVYALSTMADCLAEMAGNIIPAIATTNAITAGLCVLQAFKVLRNDLQSGKMVGALVALVM
jgi:ubiquitin-like 1-activating enzyme E1 B